MRMLRLMNNSHVVFFPVDAMDQAKAFRSNHPEFARKRIVDVLQLQPSKIQYGVVYER